MKKVVYAVYHDVNHEARSMELLQCCRLLGEVDFISFKNPIGVVDITSHIINKKSPFALFHFISKIKKVISKVQPDIIVLHDNDCAAIIPYAKKKCKNAKIVYDSSELYIPMDGQKDKVNFNNGIKIALKQKLSSFRKRYEKKYLKYADLVFAANIERAEIMKRYFNLSKTPEVFDNVHKIEDAYDIVACDQKWGDVFNGNSFKILFGGGINEERQTFDYIKAFQNLGGDYKLIIVGAASDIALKQFKTLTQGQEHRIVYLGYITRAELRYCIQRSQASVVLFDKKSYNTLYCASGKFYESLFENVPILASENPPLKRICSEYFIGVSDDDFVRGIIKLKEQYPTYVSSVKEYIKTIPFETRVEDLYQTILRTIYK